MQEINYSGNLFLLPGADVASEAAVVTTNGMIKQNGCLVMGRGIAGYSRDHHAGVDAVLARHVRRNGNTPAVAGVFRDSEREKAGLSPEVNILSMPTKDHWKDKSSLSLIIRSCQLLMKLADATGLSRIYLPMPGCSNGGLDYEKTVRPAILRELDDRFVVMVPGLSDRMNDGIRVRMSLQGYDKDADYYDVLACADTYPALTDRLLSILEAEKRAGSPVRSSAGDPYDWYEIQAPGARAVIVDPTGRLHPSRLR